MRRKLNTQETIQLATTRLSDDICELSERRDDALSIFRHTAKYLSNINNQLQDKLNDLDALEKFIHEQKFTANQLIADNDAVRSRIVDIIGE
jgi:hypothetical protein